MNGLLRRLMIDDDDGQLEWKKIESIGEIHERIGDKKQMETSGY